MKKTLFYSFLLLSFYASAQTLETFAGTGLNGYVDGPADQARFSEPEQVAVDQEGNAYVCDTENHVIRKVSTTGQVTTFAGTGVPGDQYGPKETARFNRPIGIAIDPEDNIYIADASNHKIKVIRPDGLVVFVAGSGVADFADGPVASAMFNFPTHLCVDTSNNLFVTGNNDNRIRKIDLTAQMVSTFAGSGVPGLQDGIGTEARFFWPQGIAIDNENNLYVGDRANNAIRKITPSGEVTTLGGTGAPGHVDGPGEQARFNGPKGVAVDSVGNVYVADRLNYVVRKIDTDGMVSTVAGVPGSSGYLDGVVSDGALIGRAVDVTWFKDQSLLISDWENNVIRKLSLAATPTSIKEKRLPPNETIRVSPNPCTDFVHVSGELGHQFQVALLNVNGTTMGQWESIRTIHLKDVVPGIYFIQITGKNYFNVEKVVVK